MSVLFSVPDAIYHNLAMWHLRRKHSKVNTAFRLVYVVLLVSTLGHFYVKSPTRVHVTISCAVAFVTQLLKNAKRTALLH